MHIVQIVIKNTSTLDFTIPLFWHIRNNDQSIKISILYCVFDKREILRNSLFYTDFCRQHNIQLYDFSDFLKWRAPLLRKFLRGSKIERMTFFEIRRKLKKGCVKSLFDLTKLILYKVKLTIQRRLVDFNNILPKIAPDIVFFDNRDNTRFIGRDSVFSYLYNQQVPTYLIPHAPHMRDAISEFCPFDEKGEALPNFCRFMIPFKHGTPWVGMEEKKGQFFISGYPGFDSDWIQYCTKGKANMGKEGPISLLFIIRRFLPKGVKRAKDTDIFIIDYEEFIKPLRLIKSSMLLSGREIHLIIKPHPANNYNELQKVMEVEGIASWEISHEPIYGLLNRVDITCSLASTVLLVPALASIPTIIFDTSLQRTIHKTWDKLEDLYVNMQFYLRENDRFQSVLLDIIDKQHKGCDEQEIRKSFEDFSSSHIVSRINSEKGLESIPN